MKDRIQTVPQVLTTLVEGTLTNTAQIELKWQPLTAHAETGGSTITSYNVQWDAGQFGLLWSHLVGYDADMTATAYIVT